jgi:hypothetical protein
VFGIGTSWGLMNLKTTSGTPVKYLGANGNQGLMEVGGSGNAIIESNGGAGKLGFQRNHRKKETDSARI